MHRILSILLIMSLFVVFSCNKDSTGPALETRTWQLKKLVTRDAAETVPSEIVITATFQEGQVMGNGGCNTYGAVYTVSGNQLAIGPLASTYVYCSKADNLEDRFFAAMRSSQSWEMDGLSLKIQTADAQLFFKAQ